MQATVFEMRRVQETHIEITYLINMFHNSVEEMHVHQLVQHVKDLLTTNY